MEDNSQLTSYLVESLNGIETVKAYNAERSAGIETEKKFVKFMRSIFKNGWINNLSGSLSGFLSMVGGAAILWLGAYKVIKGEMSLGELITFNALLAYFLNPVQNLINLQPTIQTAIVAAERLGEILNMDAENTEVQKIVPKSLKGDIQLQNIDFRYGTRQLVLNGVNLNIRQSEKIAFVGESGSGKTTLVKLLMNFYFIKASGIVRPGENVSTISSMMTGRVDMLNISEGDRVQKGDLLFKVDTADMEQSLAALEKEKQRIETENDNLKKLDESIKSGENLFDGDAPEAAAYYLKYEKYISDLQSLSEQYKNTAADTDKAADSAAISAAGINSQIDKLKIDLDCLKTLKNSMLAEDNLFTDKYSVYALEFADYRTAVKACDNDISVKTEELEKAKMLIISIKKVMEEN